jgi:hypothetical protein
MVPDSRTAGTETSDRFTENPNAQLDGKHAEDSWKLRKFA